MKAGSKIFDFSAAQEAGRQEGARMLSAVRAGGYARYCPTCQGSFPVGTDAANYIAVFGRCDSCTAGAPPPKRAA